MADPFAPKTMKRKNKKGLALSAPPPKPAPSESDAQAPGGLGNAKEETLEIGVEFQLDLKAEDLIVLRELGSGNGGTVSKVQHAATKVIMARKVRWTLEWGQQLPRRGADSCRSYMSKQRTRYGNASCASCASCTSATRPTLSISTAPSRTTPGTLSCAWSIWMWGKLPHKTKERKELTCWNSALDWVSRQFGPVRVDVLGKIAEAVLGGLSYLYSAHRIMHRDLKPSNILVNSKGQIKLCDFGVSSELDGSIAETFVGTGTYMAPERIQGSPYTVKSDVWSVGLSIMELAIGKFPFSGSADDDEAGGPQGILDLLQQIVLEPAPKLPKSDAFPSILEDMVAKCLLKDPKERPTPKELYVRQILFSSDLAANLT
jgi:mitogen-activated protein kinase kinase